MTNIQSNTEYDYNTTTIQMGFRRKSNDLFKSVSQEFTLITNMCIGGFRNSQSDVIFAHAHIRGRQRFVQLYGICVKCGFIFWENGLL